MVPASRSLPALDAYGNESPSSTHTITAIIYQHSTPPRSNRTSLPNTPSSDRLRRVAPGPLAISSSRLRYTPPSPPREARPPIGRQISFSPQRRAPAPPTQPHELVESEPIPLADVRSVYEEGEAEVTAIVQSYMRRTSAQSDDEQPEADEEVMEFPIVLDNRSAASESALRLCIARRPSEQRVPEDVTDEDEDTDEDFLKVSPPVREEEERMTPEEYIRSIYKPKVLIRFNTHVFGEPAPGEANDDSDNGSTESDRVAHVEEEADEDRKASTTSSFYAPERYSSISSSFYAPEREASISSSFYAPERPSTELSDFSYDETVRNTVIQEEEEEEDNDTTPRARPPTSTSAFFASLPDELALAPPPPMDTSERTPDSVNTELITPDHDDVPLPLPPRGFSEEGYRRPGPTLHENPTDRRFLPAKSAFRPSTAPTGKEPKLKRSGGLARAPEIVCLPKRAKRISPPANEGQGLGLDTGRGSIDLDHERAIEHAGGTPGPPKRVLDDREAPPVPLLPDFLRDEPITDPEIMAAMAGPPRSPDYYTREELGPTDLPTTPWPEDLARIDKEMTIELEVTDNNGLPLKCVLPIRRLSRPEFWQIKEDQELAKADRWGDNPPKSQPFQQTGAVVFGEAPKKRTQWLLFSGKRLEAYLRKVVINHGPHQDQTTGKIKLNVDETGVYNAFGYDTEGEVDWVFQYLVTYREPPSDFCQKAARYVYPMYFFAASAFLDARKKDDDHSFCKVFDVDDEAESELVPPPRVGRLPMFASEAYTWSAKDNESPELSDLDEDLGYVEPGFEEGELYEYLHQPTEAPATSRMGRVIKVITKIVRSRPNTAGSAGPTSGSTTIMRGAASATPPPRSAGLLGGLVHKLANRSGTNGDVLISSSCHSAPVSHGSRSDLAMSRIDTMASVNTTKSGKSVRGIMSRLITKSSSRPGSAREAHFPRPFGNPKDISTGTTETEPAILGRRRSKSAASRVDVSRKTPSPHRVEGQIIRSTLIDDSPKSDPGRSGKTMMDRLRTLSAGGSRPGSSRAKSPLSAESIVPAQTFAEVEEEASGKSVIGRSRPMSSGGSRPRPGSSRATPTVHPEFDLDELLKAREASGSALSNHMISPLLKPSKGPLERVRSTSPGNGDSLRSESPPPFVLQTVLRDPAFGSGNSLASLANSGPGEDFRPKTARGPSPRMRGPSPVPGHGQSVRPSTSKRILKTEEPRLQYENDQDDTDTVRASSPDPSSLQRQDTFGGTEASRIAASWKRETATSGTAVDVNKPRLSIASFTSLLTTTEDEMEDSDSGSDGDREGGPRGSMDPAEVARRLQDIQQGRPTPIRQISIPVPRSRERPTTSNMIPMPVKVNTARIRPSTATRKSPERSSAQSSGGADSMTPKQSSLVRQPTIDKNSRSHRKALLVGDSARFDKALAKFSTEHPGSTPRPAVWVNPAPSTQITEPMVSVTQSKNPTKEIRLRTKSDRLKAKFGVPPSAPTVVAQENSANGVTGAVAPRTGRVISKIKSLSALNPNVQRPSPTAVPSMPATNIPRLVVDKKGISGSEDGPRYTKEEKGKGKALMNVPPSPAMSTLPASQAPSLWKRLTKPKSSSSLKSISPSPSTEAPPPLPRSAQPLEESSLLPRDDRPILPHTARSADPRVGPTVERPLLPHLARSAGPTTSTSASSLSTQAGDVVEQGIYIAPTKGIVLMQNTPPPHLKDAHPFAIAMRPIQGQITGSEWTHSNPKPTHYLVEDPVFKKAMEKHREEERNTPLPSAMRILAQMTDSGPSSADSSATFGSGRTMPKPIVRKRPSTTQVAQEKENQETGLPRHLRPNKWNPREQLPSSAPSVYSGPVPPKRAIRPSTAQPGGHI